MLNDDLKFTLLFFTIILKRLRHPGMGSKLIHGMIQYFSYTDFKS